MTHTQKFCVLIFLSTLSLRRATSLLCLIFLLSPLFLSTLSLRRATTALLIQPIRRPDFYPRSPCGERHIMFTGVLPHDGNFYPRSPCGERLIDTSKDVIKTTNFYPRSPCGERPLAYPDMIICTNVISIHALLAESD